VLHGNGTAQQAGVLIAGGATLLFEGNRQNAFAQPHYMDDGSIPALLYSRYGHVHVAPGAHIMLEDQHLSKTFPLIVAASATVQPGGVVTPDAVVHATSIFASLEKNGLETCPPGSYPGGNVSENVSGHDPSRQSWVPGITVDLTIPGQTWLDPSRVEKWHCNLCPAGTTSFRNFSLGRSCVPCDTLGRAAGVGMTVECAGGSHAKAPFGKMLMYNVSKGSATPDAYHCPNPRACPGGTLWMAWGPVDNGTETAFGWRPRKNDICAAGYDPDTPGCLACQQGYGRQQWDPFTCKMCGLAWVGWGAFVVQPLVLFILGLRSAGQAEQASSFSSILKILLSWMQISSLVMFVLPFGHQYHKVATKLDDMLSKGEAIRNIPFYSPSLDCLLNRMLTPGQHLGLRLLIPVASLVVVLVTQRLHGYNFHQIILVWTNTFLPEVTGCCWRYVPCVAVSKEYTRLAAHAIFRGGALGDADWTCSGYEYVYRLVRGSVGLLVCILVGPVYWLYVIRDSRSWEPKKRSQSLNFLIQGYKPSCDWWEVTVLTRKMMLVVCAAALPVSSCPGLYVLGLMFIMILAQVAHAEYTPYEQRKKFRVDLCCFNLGLDLNRTERAALTAGNLTLVLAGSTLFAAFRQPMEIFWLTLAAVVLVIMAITLSIVGLMFATPEMSGMLHRVDQTEGVIENSVRSCCQAVCSGAWLWGTPSAGAQTHVRDEGVDSLQ